MPRNASGVYHYTECGLDNVFIEGVSFETDEDGNDIVEIPAVNMLHKAIAESIVLADGLIAGKEIRFLRTEMGLTPEKLAKLLHVEVGTLERWEKGVEDVGPARDVLIRQLTADILDLQVGSTFDLLSCDKEKIDSSSPINFRHKSDGKRHQYMVAA